MASFPLAASEERLLPVPKEVVVYAQRAHGHAKELRGKEILDWMIKACEEIVAGQTENDQPYHYFGGVCRQHPISGTPGEVIVYNEGK